MCLYMYVLLYGFLENDDSRRNWVVTSRPRDGTRMPPRPAARSGRRAGQERIGIASHRARDHEKESGRQGARPRGYRRYQSAAARHGRQRATGAAVRMSRRPDHARARAPPVGPPPLPASLSLRGARLPPHAPPHHPATTLAPLAPPPSGAPPEAAAARGLSPAAAPPCAPAVGSVVALALAPPPLTRRGRPPAARPRRAAPLLPLAERVLLPQRNDIVAARDRQDGAARRPRHRPPHPSSSTLADQPPLPPAAAPAGRAVLGPDGDACPARTTPASARRRRRRRPGSAPTHVAPNRCSAGSTPRSTPRCRRRRIPSSTA